MFAAGGKTTAKKQTSPETKVDSVKNKEQSEVSFAIFNYFENFLLLAEKDGAELFIF